jgi:hypothetical protein
MTTSSPGASAPAFLTSSHPFSTAVCSRDLFAVNPGIPAGAALEAASSYLDAALNQVGKDYDAPMIYLVELAKAIVDAVAVELDHYEGCKERHAREGGAV